MAALTPTENTQTKQAPWALIALICGALSVVTHAYLAIQGFKLKVGLAEKSACNLNSAFNCDAVSLSPFAQFLGIPIAVWGLITNAILGVFLLIYIVNLASRSDRIERVMFWLSSIVLLASVVMGTISTLYLKTYCLFCIATYAFSAVQFICIYFLQSTKPLQNLMSDLTRTFSEQVWIPVLIGAVPVGTVLANSIIGDMYGFRMATQAIQESLFDWSKNETQNFSADGLRLKKGTAPTKMLIVEFADFLCIHCKHAAPTLHNFVESRPDVEFLFKPFPLDGTCNKNMGGGSKGDGHRCKLAAAVLCAESLGAKGWIAHEYFFERQANLSLAGFAKNLEEVSAMTGVGLDSMKTCIDSEETMTKLLNSSEEGIKAKIPGTPAIFVNGKLLPRAQFFPVLEAVYKELSK